MLKHAKLRDRLTSTPPSRLKLAKTETRGRRLEGEGEGSEGTGSTVTLSESKQALVRLAIDLIAAMPDNKTDDAYDDLLDLFARYEG
jgi:hypothetical protein